MVPPSAFIFSGIVRLMKLKLVFRLTDRKTNGNTHDIGYVL